MLKIGRFIVIVFLTFGFSVTSGQEPERIGNWTITYEIDEFDNSKIITAYSIPINKDNGHIKFECAQKVISLSIILENSYIDDSSFVKTKFGNDEAISTFWTLHPKWNNVLSIIYLVGEEAEQWKEFIHLVLASRGKKAEHLNASEFLEKVINSEFYRVALRIDIKNGEETHVYHLEGIEKASRRVIDACN